MAAERTRRFVSRSPEATEAAGERIGRALAAGAVVALDGELGAGKTCFVRGLARGLGVRDAVTSPTFALMHEHEGRVPLLHLDAWRTEPGTALLEEGAAELLGGEAVAAVEWASRVAGWLPRPRLEVRLEHRGPTERRLAVRLLEGDDDAREDLERALEAAGPAPDLPEEPGLGGTGLEGTGPEGTGPEGTGPEGTGLEASGEEATGDAPAGEGGDGPRR